jgi:cephalosporin-C deacetylase
MFADWMWETAALIKSIDPNHMVSSGSEGYHGCEQNFDLFEKIHSCPDIDYMNIHIWPYNWSWVREKTLATNLDKAIANTDAYIDAHLEIAARHGKPVVLEEFGFPRDSFQFAKGTPTTCRDTYYEHVLQRIVQSAKEGGLFAGLNFWSWGGFAEQSATNIYWQPGDDYCGDPAQEQQGLNSVYASDESTVAIIRNAAEQMLEAQKPTARFCLENDGLYFEGAPQTLKATVNSRQDMKVQVILTLTTDMKVPVRTYVKKVYLAAGETGLEYDLKLVPGFYVAVLETVEPDGTKRELARTNIGFEPEKILSPQDKQEDFDEFWAQTLTELRATDPEYKLTLLKEYSDDVRRTYRVDMTGFGGEPTCGILVEPVAEGCYETVINYMGYGAEIWYPNPSDAPERVQFILCNRNQSLNRKPDEDNLWCTRGLESKDTYYYRGVFADAVRAIDFVCSRPKVDQDRLYAEGGSQGGAITLVAASLDDRLDAIAPSVPFLSDYKDYFQIVEWPGNWILEAAQQKGISEEDLYTTLSYFDVKNFTDRIQCPVLMGFGLQDVTCPPHTNFAGYNMIKAPKSWICYPERGHDVWREETWPQEVENWFRQASTAHN